MRAASSSFLFSLWVAWLTGEPHLLGSCYTVCNLGVGFMSLIYLRSFLRISFLNPLRLVDIPLSSSRKYFRLRKFSTGLLYVSVWERENSYVRYRMRDLILEWAPLYGSGCQNHLTLLPSFGRTLLCLGLDQRSSLSSHFFSVLPHLSRLHMLSVESSWDRHGPNLFP